jgi:hypothetical protein
MNSKIRGALLQQKKRSGHNRCDLVSYFATLLIQQSNLVDIIDPEDREERWSGPRSSCTNGISTKLKREEQGRDPGWPPILDVLHT